MLPSEAELRANPDKTYLLADGTIVWYGPDVHPARFYRGLPDATGQPRLWSADYEDAEYPTYEDLVRDEDAWVRTGRGRPATRE